MLTNKLGRLPRKFSPKVMHLSAIFGAVDLPPVPDTADWTQGITAWGMMMNDTLGDCTCAAVYHARQVWTAATGAESTETDVEPLRLYEAVGGYNPNDPSTDQGAAEQDILQYWLKTGVPLDGNQAPDKIAAFFEVDPRNTDDVKRVINECGVCYIGFDVPDDIDETPGSTWEYNADAGSQGGHAVVLVGYDADTVTLISWGALYKMTWEFFTKQTDEAYAVIDPSWLKDGNTPLGLTKAQLQQMMAAIKQ